MWEWRTEGGAKGKQLLDKASRETWKDWQMCYTCQNSESPPWTETHSSHLFNKVRLPLWMFSYLFDKTPDTQIHSFSTSILFFSIMFEHVTVSAHSSTWKLKQRLTEAQLNVPKYKYLFALFVCFFLVWWGIKDKSCYYCPLSLTFNKIVFHWL